MASIKFHWILLIGIMSVFMPHGSTGEDPAAVAVPTPPVVPPVQTADMPNGPVPDGSINGPPAGATPTPGQNPGVLPPAAANDDGQAVVTQYKNPDGSIITVSRYNGNNIPESLLQPHLAGIYHPWNNPFLVNPFGWPYGPQHMYQGPGQPRVFPADPIPVPIQPQTGGTLVQKQKRSISATPPLKPTQARTSTNFHYPALPEVYWSTHKKPEVPVVDVDNTKLEHIYGNSVHS